MILPKLLSLYKTEFWLIIASGIAFAVLAVLSHLLFPPKYIATGSFYVSRPIEVATPDFKYEGYYASLASQNYARTLAALIESEAIKAQVLEDLNIPVTRDSLKKLDKAVKIKKPETQLVTLQIKMADKNATSNTWQSYSAVLTKTSTSLNGIGDNTLNVNPVNAQPVVYLGYSNVYVMAFLGFLVGLFLAFFALGAYFLLRESYSNEIVY